MRMFLFMNEGLHFIRYTSTSPLGKVVRKTEHSGSRVGYEFPYRCCMVVSSLDFVVRDIYGLYNIAMEHLVQVIHMVLN